jgi:hypothetical protein
MAIHYANPNSNDTPAEWNGVPFQFDGLIYKNIDEGIVGGGFDESDYIWANTPAPSERNTFYFPADAPGDMIEVTRLQVALYIRAVKISIEPAINFKVYLGSTFQDEIRYWTNTGGQWKVLVFTMPDIGPLTPAEYNTVRIEIVNVQGLPGDALPFEEWP